MSADRPGLHEERDPGLVNAQEWLAGYAAFERGDPIPWGDETSHKAGWVAAKKDAAHTAHMAKRPPTIDRADWAHMLPEEEIR